MAGVSSSFRAPRKATHFAATSSVHCSSLPQKALSNLLYCRPVKLVLASANAGKLRELAALLEPLGHRIVTQAVFGIESAPETGATFTENALLKARHAAL